MLHVSLTWMIFARRVLCCFLLCAPLVCAASDSTAPQNFVDGLKGKVVFLWGMETGDKLSFDAQGQEIGSYEKIPFAYSAVKIEGVHKSSTAVEIKGRRVALVFQTPALPLSTNDLRFVPLKEPVEISIAVNASDAQASEAALNQVFATTAVHLEEGRQKNSSWNLTRSAQRHLWMEIYPKIWCRVRKLPN